jgi:hypothetical protein
MSTQYAGQPALIEENLPAAKNIASTTNTTPIVLTTSTSHMLLPGDYFTVDGATDPNANGTRMAGTVTATTVVLLEPPGGGNTIGTLNGGAVGTIQALGFGETYPLPDDATDDMDAASVNVALEELGDRTAYLQVFKGNLVGNNNWGGNQDFNGIVTFEQATRFRAPAYLSDANHTLDHDNNANNIVLLTPPAGNRILTLRQSTSPVPVNGDWFEVTVILGTSSHTVALQREGAAGGDYVAVFGDGVGTSPFASSNLVGTAKVQLVSGVWRLTAVGGVVFYGSDA